MAQTQQAATLSGNTWNVNYLLDASLADPTGAYTVTAQTEDNAGNRATAATAILRLDASGPTAALSAIDATRQVITQTLTIGGVVTDTNSIAGIDKLEIAFTPVEQIAALPGGITSDQAEAQLNRTWTPVSDSYGRCAQASTPRTAARQAVAAATTAAAPGAPLAVIVAPANGGFVAADTNAGVTVAAEAGAALKEVTISLDNSVVQTLAFAPDERCELGGQAVCGCRRTQRHRR